MSSWLLVFLGAGIGGTLRHGVNVAMPRLLGGEFPWHTLTVNVAGSLAMGALAGYFALKGGDAAWRLFLTTGVLGGFTTFSAFSAEAVLLYERGDLFAMGAYVLASLVLSIAAMVLGLYLVRG